MRSTLFVDREIDRFNCREYARRNHVLAINYNALICTTHVCARSRAQSERAKCIMYDVYNLAVPDQDAIGFTALEFFSLRLSHALILFSG